MKTLTPGKRFLHSSEVGAWHVPTGLRVGQRIGLLGGSFNPAHEGHVDVSLLAIDLLELDEIWWLVTPQNPLKSEDGMTPLTRRLRSAQLVAAHHPIQVTDIEAELDTTFTTETLAALKHWYPEAHFVWLMGADNLRQIPKWRGWQRIFRMVPIAIFPRPSYSRRALAGKASRRFKRFQIKPARAPRLATMRAPAWVFLRTQPNTTSATRIRARLEREEPQ